MARLRQALILGIDPGLSGAIAFYAPGSKELIALSDMPLLKRLDKSEKKRWIDPYTLATAVDAYSKDTLLACIEEPSAMPGQGVVSTFRFGLSCGLAQGVCASSNIPMRLVKPSVWKALMGLSRDKSLSIKKAQQLFPAHADQFLKKDGRAEAALLAYFGVRFLNL